MWALCLPSADTAEKPKGHLGLIKRFQPLSLEVIIEDPIPEVWEG